MSEYKLPEPHDYLFQHEETGRVQTVDKQQVEWGFEKNNPQWKRISGMFTETQMRDAFASGQATEREMCADLCGWLERSFEQDYEDKHSGGARECARWIRSRSNQ